MSGAATGDALTRVRAQIAAAAVAAGRDPASVGLIAVSKTQPASAIRAAYDAGHRAFGENYPQELRDKARELALPDLHWHFIGRLQANKAKYVAPLAWRVHALESVAQAEALVARAPGPLSCLVSVNVGGEASKGGVSPAELPALCDRLAVVPGLRLVGLMCLPPEREDPEDVAPFFAETAALCTAQRGRGHEGMVELSMGMSHDFPVAIRHGATWVRVGTAIFGARG